MVLVACVNKPRNYIPAGFTSANEVKPYLENYIYFSSKLTKSEWDAFYARFPEYYQDIHVAKGIGSTIDIHPWYAAYAFRWTTLNKRKSWPPEIRSRLDKGDVLYNDDVFQLVYAMGPPSRVIWDNDIEVLLYAEGAAFIIGDSKIKSIKKCPGCWQDPDKYESGMSVLEVIKKLGSSS